MSTTYKIVSGDTFETVARKVYGTEADAHRIAAANPGTVEPLLPGVEIIIPVQPDAPTNRRPDTAADHPDEVAILIDGERFRFWESVKITRSVDSFDTAGLRAPFSVDLPGFRETFRPFRYKNFDISVGGVRLFSGTMTGISPSLTPAVKSITAEGYSRPGVLHDCTPPAAAPDEHEFNNQTLREIAGAICAPFGLSAVFEADPGPAFERVAIVPGKKALAFLVELAKQRNLIISNTAAGELLFHRPEGDGPAVAKLRQGASPLVSAAPNFSPQEYYSHITGIEPVFLGLEVGPFTVKNKWLGAALRPLTFKVEDTEEITISDTVNAKMGRMFANAAGYTAQVATWRDPSGGLWAPGSVVSLDAPDAMVYGEHKFMIRRVDFVRTRDSEAAVLDLILPGSFSGRIPEVLPWEN